MKFYLSLLLLAPAVMAKRGCGGKPRRTTTSVGQAAPTLDVPVVSSVVAVPDTSATSAPQVGDKPKEDSSVEQPQTTLQKVVSSSQPSATQPASSPETTDSGSGSGSDKSSGSGNTVLDSTAVTGSSTFYGGNLAGGNCMFTTYKLPASIYGTAFSGQPWDNAANCGACIEVTGPSGKPIIAMVVDQCPECTKGHLDLFPDAFTAVGGTNGVVNTSYKFVSCGITSPIVLKNKSGTSAHWFSMQVLNHNVPIKSLEVSINNGQTWTQTTRKDYNFFENPSGFGTESVDVRVTSTTGKTIVVKSVSVAADSEHDGGSNF